MQRIIGWRGCRRNALESARRPIMQGSSDAPAQRLLEQAGLAAEAAADWLGSEPDLSGDYRSDAAAGSHFWLAGSKLVARLPPKPKRGAAQAAAADLITQT